MNGWDSPWISDPQGSVHSGSGNQYNFIWHGTPERLVRAGVTRLRIVRAYRQQLVRCFVPPQHYGRARDRMGVPGAVVLLDGPPGSGRRAAATVLLETVSVPGGRVEELPAEGDEEVFDAAADDRYLLDLSGVSDADYAKAQRTLTRYRGIIEQCGARMVVVLPAGLQWMLDQELSSQVERLERPRGRAVFARYLRVRGVDFEPEQLDTDALTHLFATAPMRELARLAELLVRARDGGRCGPGFDAWRDEAIAAATNWSEQVATELRDHRTGPERALLLTAAMISGAGADAVLSGAHSLLRILPHTQDETPRLEQAGLGEQLADLSIVTGDDDRVGFPRLAYDHAIRQHFWKNFPDLRAGFRDWVGQCMELPELRSENRMHLVAHFAEQALASGRPDDLCVLVERWTRPAAAGRLRAEAAATLELGLSHDEYGSRFRSRVYDWATNGHITAGLARVLIDICHQVMAATHPDQATVRLRHLALRQRGEEAAAARAALLDMARGNRRVFRRLTDQLVRDTATSARSFEILLALLEPEELRIGPPPWRELTLVWGAVMTARPAAVWAPLVRRWLSALVRRPADDQILRVLLLATAGDYGLLNSLYAAACDWNKQPLIDGQPLTDAQQLDRERVAARFCQEIDVMQGVGRMKESA
ncbi:hypothetical protein [Streptomyces youssoufiensis]